MKCLKCGFSDSPPKFKYCGECGSKLPRAFATKDGREDFTQVNSTAQQTDAGGKSALGVHKRRFKDDNSQQGESTTVSEHELFSAARSDGHGSADAIHSDQSKSPPADKGLGTIDVQGTAERRPESPTAEGVKQQQQKRQLPQRPQQQDQLQQMPPTQLQNYSYHQQMPLVDQKHYNQHQENPRSDKKHYIQQQQMLPSDQKHYIQQQQMPVSDQKHYIQHQQMPPSDQKHRVQQQQMPPSDQKHYLQQRQMPPPDQKHYIQQQQLTPSDQKHYFQQQQMPPSDQKLYIQQQQMPPPDQKHYIQQQQMPPSDREHYIEQQQMPPSYQVDYIQQQHMPPSGQKHYTEQQQMPPSDQKHYIQQLQMPPSDQKHYIQQQRMPPSERKHHFQQQQLPPSDQKHCIQYQQMVPTDPQHNSQNQDLLLQEENQPGQPPLEGQVFNQHLQPSSLTEQQDLQVDYQRCPNGEASPEDNRTEIIHLPPTEGAPGSSDPNASSEASRNRRRRDDTATQINDQNIEGLEGTVEGKESNKVNNGDSSGTIPNEKMEPTALVLSPSPEGNATALEHPMSDQTNEHDDNEVELNKKGGVWYQKHDTIQHDSESDRGKKKGSKKQGKGKGVHPPLSANQDQHSLKQVDPENGITVVFDVLLETNFKMDEERLHIRAGAGDLGEFKLNCVDLTSVGTCKDKKNLMRFSGQFTLSLDCARQGTSYKYVVVKKGAVHWEYLPEFPSGRYGAIVNRFLSIPEKYLQPGGKWDQVDGVSYIYGERSLFGRLYDYIRSVETAENRKLALLMHLPKWSGFLLNEPGEEMDATTALVELDRVVSCLFTNVWVQEGYYSPEKKKPVGFNIKTVLSDLVQKKVKQNSTLLAQSKGDLNLRASALVSSLAIVLLLKQYDISLSQEDKLLLLRCLALECDPFAKRCTPYEVVLEEFSGGLRDRAAVGIEDLCNEVMANYWKADGEWLFAIPLLHFLRGDSIPFEEPDIAGAYNKLPWIGAQKLRIKEFQRSEKLNLMDALPQLVSAFEVDRLFKRTFINAVPIWELHKFVSFKTFHISDICVALVNFLSRENICTTKWVDVSKCIKSMVKQAKEELETAESSLKKLEFTTSICLKLLETCLKRLTFRDHLETICMLIRLLFTSMQRQRHQIASMGGDNVAEIKEDEVFSKLLKIVRDHLMSDLPQTMSCYYRSDILQKELEIWSDLLRVENEYQEFDIYRDFLIEELTSRARKVEEKYLVEIFCEVSMDGLDKAVGEAFTKLAFEAVDKIIKKKGDADVAFRSLRSSSTREGATNAGKYGELLSMLLTKSWPKVDGGTDSRIGLDKGTVEFLLSWNPMAGYLKFFGDGSGRGAILTGGGQETLSMAKSLLEALVEVLLNASITFEILLLLQEFKQRFLELVKTSVLVVNYEEGRRVATKEKIEQTLNERIEEIGEFQAFKARVLSFTAMCDLIQPVNISDVKNQASKDVSTSKICDLCERDDRMQIEVKFFELPQRVRDILSPLHRVKESSTFQQLWEQSGKKAQTARLNDESMKRELSIFNVVDNVWRPAYQAWNQLVASAFDGSLELTGVDKFFESYRNRKEDLLRELLCIFTLGEINYSSNQLKAKAKERVTQIQRYQQLGQYASAADTIWEFKEAMGFTGDFKVIEVLRNQSYEFKQRPLKGIGEQFADAGKALKCLDVDKAGCLKAVVESKRLVEWLRKTITSTQELKVLVDLALITAGESDMETDRISSLHTSCLGFAPLIFDLKETMEKKVSFDQLMKACDPVWKAVEADNALPQKLRDTSLHLEWLKTVKESHGSVAMTSLAQAKTINCSGVYHVGGKVSAEDPTTQSKGRLRVEDVVRLTVPLTSEGGKVQSKIYSLDELKDLQSKLMLIAGKAEKGKDDVETFVKNLEGVMRLATAYINLSESGFVHRMHWNQEFHCSKDQREGECTSEELAAASTAMENCYLDWKKKVSDTRKEYQELNFFTTQQLILLRKEIAIACCRSDLHIDNPQVLNLLESVRANLNTEVLKAAIQRAFKGTNLLEHTKRSGDVLSFSLIPHQADFGTRTSLFENNNYYVERTLSAVVTSPKVQGTSVKKEKAKEISKIRRFVNAAEDDGYSEQVALSALASLGVDAEEDDLLLWCLEESDDADLESLYEKAMSNPIIVREIYPQEVLNDQELHLEETSETLKQWDRSVEVPTMPDAESTVYQDAQHDEDNETEISEYLTLAQLGSILRELAVKGEGTKPRVFPAFLKRGRPNLMLVPKGDVLATVLALYMHDKQQPLPSHEEVLICTPETTTEEVELLWRRAIGNLEGRFYCLVHADQLDFSVSKQAVDKLGVLTQGLAGKMGEHYGLVVMCSSENEDRANIVAALDQYRVAAPPCPSSSDLQSYLKKHFRIPPPQYGYINSSKITWEPAGTLDPEKLCVRVVTSNRGGLGKTLYVRRLTDRLQKLINNDMVVSRDTGTSLHVTVPLHGNSTDSSMLVDSLFPHAVMANVPLSRVFHLDVSPSVRRGLDTLLFNLLVLGFLCDKMGRVWRRRMTDLYVIEITTASPLPTGFIREEEAESLKSLSGRSTKRPFYDLLPTVACSTPRTVSCRLAAKSDPKDINPLFDAKEFRSPQFQRVYQYLKLSKEGKNMDNFTFVPGNIDDDQKTCLSLMLSNCGIPDPSWAEIRHFVSFLNSQLRDCEQSIFCDMKLMRSVLAGPDVLNLEGFRSFVVRFMIQMSRDFATPSLTDENTVFYTEDNAELERREIEQFKLRRRWESSPHPYLFFNEDRMTMTFLGFFINSTGDLIDPQTLRTLEKGVMSKHLRNGLQAQRVDFTANPENWKKAEKIRQLCSVMGIKWNLANPDYDPDPAYELTTDNVKKILAIHMRFRCNIPVIVMGETGCGKTRLIRYMCGLQAGPQKKGQPRTRSMLLVKVHGGTTYEDIQQKVQKAEEMARENQDKNIDTVLFFDEANTTEALSMIKEVMVDRRIRGRPIGRGLERLQFIAACNPYRRHTDDMIHKLESAGLGYHVKTDESDDRLGHIPLRHLVYRVHALPGSMRPLIWDFGRLNDEVESLYTFQIVCRYILHEGQLPGDSSTVQAVSAVLAASQKYMRNQSDECSFVSLRDVERAMQVMVWFFKHVDTLGRLMRRVIIQQRREEGVEVEDDDNDEEDEEPIDPVTRALVLAIGVCYHAKLQEKRQDYRKVVAQSFKAPCLLPGGEKQILRELASCQRAVLNQLTLGPNIAPNTALSENVFMMVVCIELRIPLFVVGKPGSSKSLAKTVVADNMQGDAARSKLFRSFKQVHMASYQCSPLSTPEGIVATFRQCSKLQEGKNPGSFVSVVVLDEVGLAEDSPLMPLKTLHPLLEDGVTSADDVIETDEKPQRVAFIGISNWALDPAKMNRGIMLSRGVPDVRELVDSALGICSTNKRVKRYIQTLISPLAEGYAELYKQQRNFPTLKKCGKEEFFGLRDFYSLIKMVYAIAAKSGQKPTWNQLEHAIRRNFGGLEEGKPVRIFKQYFHFTEEDENADAPTTIRLIEASLRREDVADRTNFSENRYLLILTENYAALGMIQQHLLKTSEDAVVIFGSSFPNDQEYTQICRNINRIKVCMETGRTVILLNLESLYESLYDALNQYYVYFGGQKYVDLGLGTHRVKCRVHDDFKLIVIAEKDVVYNNFPIPLINRLEKHFLVTSTSLTQDQMDLVKEMRSWADKFAEVKRSRKFTIGDAFVGYHEDTIPSIIMQVCNDLSDEVSSCHDQPEDPWDITVARRCKKMLLEMATPDAIARLPASVLEEEAPEIWRTYFHEQQHSCLAGFLRHVLILDSFQLNAQRQEGLLIQVTTHSRLLSNSDLVHLCNSTGFHRSAVDFMALQQFQTEQQFRSSVRKFFEDLGGADSGILIVQCDSGDHNFNLIAGARHILLEERKNAPELLNLPTIAAVHVVLVVQLPRIAGGCRNFVGFQGGKWTSTHIDELRPPERHTPSIEELIDKPISKLFGGESEGRPDHKLLAVKFLRNCVQAAACRIDDEGGSTERSTQRIELLLHLLPEDSEGLEEKWTFAGVLAQRTFYLLKERESNAENAHWWLHSEALSGTGVQEWGTFRKALWKRIYSAVVPILAEIIGFADRDKNLDLMNGGNSWVSTLWLKIMANRNISELSYRKMISPVTETVRERVQVIGSGAGGNSFQCLFPFSFLVKERVDNLLKDALSITAQSSATLVEALRDLIDKSELGPLFRELPHEHFPALQYLTDFVHMVYKSSSESEHQLVCEAILFSARERGVEEDEMIDIALVHVAHSRIQSRLRCFSKLVQAQPEVVEKLKEVFREKQAEVLLDVITLQVCLEELTLSEEVLLGQDSLSIWCDRMLLIRPAVEDMMRRDKFGVSTEENSSYGERAAVLLYRCRSMWQRAGAVRLFVEHVTLLNECDGDEVNSESVVTLWKALGEETNFSSHRSLQTIEKFLINYTEDTRNRDNNSCDSELRRRCNAFFMELVSLFCFGESCESLEAEALSLLMRYVTGQHSAQTKDFSPFPDYGIDTTPVVRSFLLQQLLRSSTKLVKERLEAFLKEAQSLKPDPQHVKEVCFLCVQCMEDTMISRYQAKVSDSKLTVKFKHAKKICEEAFKALNVNSDKSFEMSVDTLEAVAKGRYVLKLVADYVLICFIEGDSSYTRDLDAQRELMLLLESARRFCVEGSSSTPQLYLLKQLVRLYGFECVRTMGGYQELEWVLPLEARQQVDNVIQDRFLVHEHHYRTIREGMAKAVISGNSESITTATEMQSVCKEILILLALYREVTLTNGSLQGQIISEEVKETLDGFIQNGGHISLKVQPFARQLLKNKQGDQFKELRVFPGKSSQEHTLAEIVIHTSAALQCFCPGSLSEPLATLMMEPLKLTHSYLPTMPEDNFAECIAVIAETMRGTGVPGEWYECGFCKHPYFIGECSQPMEKGQCPDCGKVIGGEQHRFLGEYKISERADRTKTGHALGPPDSRPTTPEPQRNLSPIICSLLRIIMHSAMVMGACRNPQAAAQLITPPCDPKYVAEFLWKHMQRDLDVLGRALGRSVDDAALTVHLVLQQMISLNGGQTAKTHDAQLRTRESRRNWETDFSSVVIVPVVKQLDQKLQKCSKLVMEDERFGSDPLVRTLYEFDEQKENPNLGVKPMSRSLWKYRRRITVEHLVNSFQQEALSADEDQYKVLGAFLKQEHKLRSIHFLPDIVRLQRLLMDRFHRRIDRSDAETFTIREFLQSLPRGAAREEYVNLIQSFKMAWNSCHSFLGDQGRLRVPEDLCNSTLDNDCPIALLLPSTKGMGVCSTALTYFLVNTHDEFLGTFRSMTNQESALERVPVTEVTISHLIAYDPEKDLLPLILAHCNYSLEVGKETSVQYDWAALERQLIDRFLRGRPFVDFREERFAFSRDTREDTVFASLAEKIPQEPISRVIEGQIITDLRSSLSDVCDVLSSLDIAIGFLASSGGQEGRHLKSYLHGTLKLPKERGLKSPTAEQHCYLSHTLALWRLMALEKVKIKSRNKQEPFEQMSDIFKEKLSSSDVAQLNRTLRKIDMDSFLPRLLEMILLKVKHAKESDVSMSFNEYFELYLADKGLEQIPGTENISDDIQMKHLKAVWNAAVHLSDDFHKGGQSDAA